jgi:hypothetical protein
MQQIIVVKLMGGLGAQMGQYMLGKRLSQVHKAKIYLDTTSLPNFRGQTYRLDRLKITDREIATPNNIGGLGFISVQTNVDLYTTNICDMTDNLYLIECWARSEFVDSLLPDMRKEFMPNFNMSENYREYVKDIRSKNSVAIHIRRGDYLSDKGVLQLLGYCTEEYFNNAIEIMNTKIDNPHYFIFSDDMDWVKENIKPKNATYVTGHSENEDIEELQLMRQCKHNIVSNSSFSTMAAKLNNNSNKNIICPAKFFRPGTFDDTNLFPSNWIHLDGGRKWD